MGPTRENILALLKRRKRATARELAIILEVTAPAVRQHLTSLERDGLVAGRAEKRPMGRPVRVYHLTPAAEPHFPTAYGPLALDLLRLVRKSGGKKAVQRLLEKRRAVLLKAYRKRVRGAGGKARAWETLARIRDAEGYVCETVDADGSPTLVEHHCPIRAVAKEFPEVCRQEQKLFEAVLGKKMDRTEHLVAGGDCCLYVPAKAPKRATKSRKKAKKKAKRKAKRKAKKRAKRRPAKRKPARKRALRKRR